MNTHLQLPIESYSNATFDKAPLHVLRTPDCSVFNRMESNVRSYCRAFPTVFTKASNAHLEGADGRHYIDFFAGAGALNYGHNNPAIMGRVIEYMGSNGIIHSLDFHTQAKSDFLNALDQYILEPRGLKFRVQFPGPTGTNAIEAALKLARKVTGRTNVVAFTNGFHGMSLGSLAATANPSKRAGAGVPLTGISFMPFDGFLGEDIDTLTYIESMLGRVGSGIDAPAAILIETVQGEGGLNTARADWLKRLSALARKIGALFIIDDIQAGIGRTGTFFSFEALEVDPDIVVLSKSLSGFGTPMSLVLMRPEFDVWEPGEHNGTFRGNNLGFIGATAAIENFWRDGNFATAIQRKAKQVTIALDRIVAAISPGSSQRRGRGLYQGIAFGEKGLAEQIAGALFKEGMVIETCGPASEVLKLMPPLTIKDADLDTALEMIFETSCRLAKIPATRRNFIQ